MGDFEEFFRSGSPDKNKKNTGLPLLRFRLRICYNLMDLGRFVCFLVGSLIVFKINLSKDNPEYENNAKEVNVLYQITIREKGFNY